MKRYTFALDSNGHWQRRESPDGEYYRRDDLIAAGCLMPVPAGEEIPLSELILNIMIFERGGKLFCKYGDGEYTHAYPDGIFELVYLTGPIPMTKFTGRVPVQPVKLLTLAELESDHG